MSPATTVQASLVWGTTEPELPISDVACFERARSVGFMNAGIADPEVRKKKLGKVEHVKTANSILCILYTPEMLELKLFLQTTDISYQ